MHQIDRIVPDPEGKRRKKKGKEEEAQYRVRQKVWQFDYAIKVILPLFLAHPVTQLAAIATVAAVSLKKVRKKDRRKKKGKERKNEKVDVEVPSCY